MIGATYFEILSEFYFVMLGLILMLVDSIYSFIKPQSRFQYKNVSDEIEAEDDTTISGDHGSNYTLELPKNLPKKAICCKMLLDVHLRINPEVELLSKQELNSTSKHVPLKKRTILKRPYEKMCAPSSGTTASNEKSLNLVVGRDSLNKKIDLANNFLLVIKKITEFTNRVITDKNENFFTSSTKYLSHFKYEPDCNFLPYQLESKINIVNQLLQLNFQKPQIHNKNVMDFDYNQILTLRRAAQYILNHLDMEGKAHLKKQLDEFEISDYYNYLGQNIKQNKINTGSNVTITEIDSTEEIETPKKQKNHRKRKNNKKYKKNRTFSKNVESNSPFFSSRHCFERLAFFVSTNQGLTQSKMMLEIEKELKPIKDQISELRDSMTDFVIVNHQINENGIKSNTLSVKPIDTSGHKPKSKFTVSSFSRQRLARLSNTSNIFQENCYPKIESEPKKLSPMAEMYIKLSRQ